MNRTIADEIPACISSIEVKDPRDQKTSIAASCRFPKSFSGFQGHFPDMPILPAIVQLATIRTIAEKVLDKRLSVQSYTRTKFRGMVQPDDDITCDISLEVVEEKVAGKFKITHFSGKNVSSGSFTFSNTQY